MIYLSLDYESEIAGGSKGGESGDGGGDAAGSGSSADFWNALLKREDCVLQYPYEIGLGDVCLVDARLGPEYVPERPNGGIAVAIVLHDLHLKRKKRQAENHKHPNDWNAAIHRSDGCCLACDRIAVAASDAAAGMAGEIVRMLTEEGPEGGGQGRAVCIVGDWQAFLDTLKAASSNGRK